MAREIISESRLREIISEEAARFKKKLTLEAEKKQLLKKLHEMYMEEEAMEEDVMEEELISEFFEFRKAEKEFAQTHSAEIAAKNTSALRDAINNEYVALARKYKLTGSDIALLKKTLMDKYAPVAATSTETFNAAKNDFYATHKADIDASRTAYKSGDMAYVDLAKNIQDAIAAEYKVLAKKYSILDPSDLQTFLKDLGDSFVPMDPATFKRQKEGGASLGDVVGGASAGRSKIVGQK